MEEASHVDQNEVDLENTYKWTMYTNPDQAEELVDTIKGHRTHWCYRSPLTSKSFLEKGTIDLLYSHHNPQSEKPIRPRAAIRTEADRIANIIGILPEETLEPEVVDQVYNRLGNYPGAQEQFRLAYADFNVLTKLDQKSTKGTRFNPTEVKVLYELDRTIQQFGAHRDYRISLIHARRNDSQKKSDISETLDIPVRDISTNPKDALQPNIQFHIGDLFLPMLHSAEGIHLPRRVNGRLYMPSMKSPKGLILPEVVDGDLNLSGLTSLEGVTLPRSVRDGIALGEIHNVDIPVLQAITDSVIIVGKRRFEPVSK